MTAATTKQQRAYNIILIGSRYSLVPSVMMIIRRSLSNHTLITNGRNVMPIDLNRKWLREGGINDNQEDSLIFNKTSIERGKFRGMYLKKYILMVQKNQSTSQDDIFMKPDPTNVTMKHGSYDKLNEKGYVPEETVVLNGDVVMGKVTPIADPGATGKPFKDTSEIYKMHPPGVVDRVYTGIQNHDGFEIRKMSIRSDRVPRIGDKYCFPTTANAEVLTDCGWKDIRSITKKDKVATLVDGYKLSYEHPIDTYEFDYDGDIYKLRSEHVDLDVTIDHELYAKREGKEVYELIAASELKGNKYSLKKNCMNVNPDIATFDDIEGYSFKMDDWLAFYGVWFAMGGVGELDIVDWEHDGTYIYGRKGPHIEEILNILKKWEPVFVT